MRQMQRMWINQPSSLQEEHKLHGVRVLIDSQQEGPIIDVWFTSGPVISQRMSRQALSQGWPEVK